CFGLPPAGAPPLPRQRLGARRPGFLVRLLWRLPYVLCVAAVRNRGGPSCSRERGGGPALPVHLHSCTHARQLQRRERASPRPTYCFGCPFMYEYMKIVVM
ncbi:unnamed protein product, partial [Amoebophrya sp. A120]